MISVEVKSGGVWRLVWTNATVTVSGETIDPVNVNAEARGVLIVQTDGTMDKILNTTQSQIDSGTDWIIPNAFASSAYEVRYVNLTGDPLDAATSLNEDEWGSLDNNMFFEQKAGVGTNDDLLSTITIQIRFNGGAVLDSATYNIGAQNITI